MACRLHYIVVLAYCERHVLHVVGGKTAQVYLSGLRVAHRYAVVAHGRMIGSEVAHGHRLHASYAAIIPHVGAGKAFHGVGEGVYACPFQLVSLKCLGGTGRTYAAVDAVGGYLHTVDMPHITIQRVGRRLCANGNYNRNEHGGKHKSLHVLTIKEGISRSLPRDRMKHLWLLKAGLLTCSPDANAFPVNCQWLVVRS